MLSNPFHKKIFHQEKSLQKAGVAILKNTYGKNIWHLRTSDARVQKRRGDPDDIFCFFGFFVAVEFKNGDTRERPHEKLQNYNIMRIREANGFAFVCRDIQELLDGFSRIKDLIKNR